MPRVKLYNGDCNALVDPIVQELKKTEQKSLNLAFLDPEGMELHWEAVAKLASVRRMDLIINYPQGGLSRMMAVAIKHVDNTNVDRFFGTRDWRTIYKERGARRGGNLHRALIDLYKLRLNELGYQEVIGADEVAGNEPLMRNLKRRAPLYRLLFASKHPIAQEFWSSITRRDVYGQRRLFDSR